jgi:hypothetical protein
MRNNVSLWTLLYVCSAGLAVVLMLDAAARWNLSSGVVLGEYDRLLKKSRERTEALSGEISSESDAGAIETLSAESPPAESSPEETPESDGSST